MCYHRASPRIAPCSTSRAACTAPRRRRRDHQRSRFARRQQPHSSGIHRVRPTSALFSSPASSSSTFHAPELASESDGAQSKSSRRPHRLHGLHAPSTLRLPEFAIEHDDALRCSPVFVFSSRVEHRTTTAGRTNDASSPLCYSAFRSVPLGF